MDSKLCCCKLIEIKEMLKSGAPLSVISQTLKISIHDIIHLDDERALGK